MIATPQPSDPDAVFVRQLLALSNEVDAEEARIKRAILAAARVGDTDRVIDIVTRWQTLPALEVLRRSRGGRNA